MRGAIGLKFDYILSVGDDAFLTQEEHEVHVFNTKPRTVLSSTPTSSNVSNLSTDDGIILMAHAEKISLVEIPMDQKAFSSERALAQYIGVNTHPDVCTNVQLVAPGSAPTTNGEYKSFSKTVTYLHETGAYGLKFRALGMETMRILVFSEASFTNTRYMGSQLGFVISIDDA